MVQRFGWILIFFGFAIFAVLPQASYDRVQVALAEHRLFQQVRQRDLSHVIGVSLGMTNAILKRSYRYFKRTIRNIVYYREAIEAFVHDVKSRGYQGIALAGASDLDFIVGHACEICGVGYLRDDAAIKAARSGSNKLFLLYTESYIPDEEKKRARPASAFLQEVACQGAGWALWDHSSMVFDSFQLAAAAGIGEAYRFGSVTRPHGFRDESDVDLAVVGAVRDPIALAAKLPGRHALCCGHDRARHSDSASSLLLGRTPMETSWLLPRIRLGANRIRHG